MKKKPTKKMTLHIETLRDLDASRVQAAMVGTIRGCSATHLCSGCKPCY